LPFEISFARDAGRLSISVTKREWSEQFRLQKQIPPLRCGMTGKEILVRVR
jgi:hypothetical protein